ncbi:hypothetical protein ABT297_08785 [Dactylosporangium sp. NPDC000555]|uniref:hypothetical protein n=1 Tax=Dactylosporangium sp. NPDC000555 TaxID=3154260 RepID=UPI003320DA3D
MKLTVGPLPAGVYWRRRVIVGGVLVVALLLLWASCGGGGDPNDKKTSLGASGEPTTSAAVEPTTTIQVPTTGEPPASSAPPVAVSSSAPQPSATVPACADADLSLVAAPETAVQFRGAYLKFTLKIKNISSHDCARDVGADAQELYLQAGAVKVWSSDACDAPHGSQMAVLKPNIEMSYTNVWNGKATNNGCANRQAPPAGKYELVGRLDTKLSQPVQVQLT